MNKLSFDSVMNSLPETEPEVLRNINTTFFTNNFDAFAMNKAVNGNVLVFNLMYLYHKLDWKE